MGRPDLSVDIAGLRLANPLIAASGCFGYGVEYANLVDLSTLGAVAVKGLFLEAREGHPPPRIVETPSGMLNAIGLQGIGVRSFVAEKLPELQAQRAVVIVNICGSTVEEYAEIARILSDADGVAAIEINISCPNIDAGGHTFGCSLTGVRAVVRAVRAATTLPIFPKLTPNVTDVAASAVAAEEAGADAVSLVNTFLAMAIDVETRRPRLSNVVGGLSGPAIRPIAVRMVYECRKAVRIPIVTGQHLSGDGDRRGDTASAAVQRRRRPERSGHPSHRRAHGVRMPQGGAHPDCRHAGGNCKLRGSRYLAEAPGGRDRLPGAARACLRRRGRRNGRSLRAGDRMDQLVETAP